MAIEIEFFIGVSLVAIAIFVYLYSKERAVNESLRREKEALMVQKFAVEKQLTIAQTEMEQIQKRLDDWEKVKAESLVATKAAISEVTVQVSNKLLEDHKRESEAAKKDSEERTKKITENYMEQFQSITKSVAALNSQITQTADQSKIMWKALTSPTDGGYFAEIGLENTLKSFGFIAGRDYITQFSATNIDSGARIRPDAVVFLPSETVLVIDSKASKFLLDIANADNIETEQAANASLMQTMNKNLKELESREYKNSVISACKNSKIPHNPQRVLMVMYLPTETLVERIKKADSSFVDRANEKDIIIVGPSGLSALIALSKIEISNAMQLENHEKIVSAVNSLLEALAVTISHADSVGKGIKKASEAFAAFAASINRQILPKGRGLISLGIRPSAKKQLPVQIGSFQVIDSAISDDDATTSATEDLPVLERVMEG